MNGIGIGFALVGYWVGLWGYCLLRGYDVGFFELVSTSKPPTSWPPAQLPADIIWPGTGSTTNTPSTPLVQQIDNAGATGTGKLGVDIGKLLGRAGL